ncbi:MAG TPA: valine--tRNA ligase [bacterium]|nr:valine--tRNA ligase [bacterium]
MQELPKTYDPAETEKRWYARWMARGYFHATPDPRRTPYTVMMPLPNVTGELHMGHALNNGLQDCLVRWSRMRGYNALWQPGTDHASIAVHVVMERRLAKEGKTRFNLGREYFLEETWKWKEQIGTAILGQMQRLGFSCDWERAAFTMDPGYYAAVEECFLRLYRKGLIYKGKRMINWCVKDQTSISDLEVEYVEEASTLYYIRYPGEHGGPGVVIATQRPETMLADVAVAVHPDDERYRGLLGTRVVVPLVDRPVPVIADRRVERGFGTGAVKITPGHDPLDYEIGAEHGLPVLTCLDRYGRITDLGGPKYQGQDRADARGRIVKDLRDAGALEREEPYVTSIGRCDRCKTIIEPYISDQWFCRMKSLAAPAIQAIRDGRVRFRPERWTKVYLDWMEGIRDWNISRQLWWGHRIPIWYCACGEVVASVAAPTNCPACGKRDLTQDPDILDTWFSSALWPFATLGWPRETEDLRYFYPTSALVTARDIIFLWVARMIMFGLEFMGDVPFRDVYINPTVLNIEGKRMSKSLGTGIDPLVLVDRYGADSLRFALINRCTGEQDLRFSEKMVEDTRNFANKIWNAARFVRMAIGEEDPGSSSAPARTEGCTSPWGAEAAPRRPSMAGGRTLPDRWITCRFARMAKDVASALERYEFRDACASLYAFIWGEYCDWYVEMAKENLRAEQAVADGTRRVLAGVLSETMVLLHPIMPFLTEEIWQALPHEGETIMRAAWPVPEQGSARSDWVARLADEEAEAAMAEIIGLVRAVRGMRADLGIAATDVVPVALIAPGHRRARLEDARRYVVPLIRASSLTVAGSDETGARPAGAVSALWGEVEIALRVESAQARTAARQRLQKQIREVERDLARLGERLRSASFLDRAPAEVVAADRARAHDLEARRERLARYLADLGA